MDSRKLKILTAIVDEYITTGEPVGSKSIMDRVQASSATIRNEMAELEKQGYLEQPHTSAGRVPTYNGFRLYVDSLMEKNKLSDDEKKRLDSMIPATAVTEEELVNSASLALAELTKCAAVVASQTPKFSMISKVEVIPTGKRMYVILMIASNGTITNEQLEFFDSFMQKNLQGVAIDSLSDKMFEDLTAALGSYMMTLSPLVAELLELSKEFTSQEISVTGANNLLTCKDFDQHEIISFLDNKREMMHFVDETFSGLQVLFSPESDGFVISNSSLIAAPFSKDGRQIGTLGLLGPMRLDYAKFIPYLEYFSSRLTELLTDSEEDNDSK